MISLNTQQKQPIGALWYGLVSQTILAGILLYFGFKLLSFGSGVIILGNAPGAMTIPDFVPGLVLVALGLLSFVFGVLGYYAFSFTVSERSITINSGVIFRQSKTIDFNKVENVDNVRGPIQMLFGLTTVNLWTASPNQFHTTTTMQNGRSTTSTIATPEGKLYLLQQDAVELKNMVAAKGAVLDVNIVSSQVAPTAPTTPPQV